MPPPVPEQLSRTIETLYRSESGRVLATLVRLLGDLHLAEEAMHEAFAAALESWPQTGIPEKPRPWLISTARFKAIDRMRRRARFDGTQRDFAPYTEAHIKIVWGSSTLTLLLLEHELADEILLPVFPVLLGTGKRFFSDTANPQELAFVDTTTTPTGVLINTYRYVGSSLPK